MGEKEINVHEFAEQRSNTQSVIPAGAQVSYTGKKVTDNQGIDWAQISYDGKTGWVKADGLRVEKPNLANNNDQNQTVYYGDYWQGAPHEDLYWNDFSKEKLENFYTHVDNNDFFDKTAISLSKETPRITTDDLKLSEEDHIKRWKNLAKATSSGKLQKVVIEMIDHFLDGTGTEYSNPVLTEKVSNHSQTQKFMKDFSNVFKEQINLHNGNISAFANSEDLRSALKSNGVMLSQYDYGKLGDFVGGLTMAIHGWTESQVEVIDFELKPDGTYSGTLRFIFKDNFGLDVDDLPPKYASQAGFRSWFILQHYDQYNGKYRPFKTVVEIDYPFSGQISE